MNSVIIIHWTQVGYLPIVIFTGISKMMQTNITRLVTSFNCYLIQLLLIFSNLVRCIWIFSGITSSQLRFALHNSWFNTFPWSRNGSARRSGSYTELIIDSKSLLVIGFRFKVTLNQTLLVSVFQSTPKACYDGRSPTKPLSLTPFLQSFSGMDCKTLLLLLRNFVSLKPPDKHVALKFFISWTAWSSCASNFRRSST